MISVKNGDLEDAEKIANDVNKNLIARAIKIPNYTPNVEEIQDLVEKINAKRILRCRKSLHSLQKYTK